MRAKYIILILGLLFSIGICWFLFIQYEIVKDDSKAIITFISSAGLLFSIFQILLNIFRQSDLRTKDLRIVEYKEFNKVLSEIKEACDEHMIKELENTPNLVFRLFNSSNHFASLIIANNDYLFLKIKDTEEANQ
jgi:hypothetical protein